LNKPPEMVERTEDEKRAFFRIPKPPEPGKDGCSIIEGVREYADSGFGVRNDLSLKISKPRQFQI